MKTENKKSEKRKEARNPYSGHIFFTSKSGIYEGRLKNYSDSGIFIETDAYLSVGEIITIDLPYMQETHTKIKGKIVRYENKGFGIELLKHS